MPFTPGLAPRPPFPDRWKGQPQAQESGRPDSLSGECVKTFQLLEVRPGLQQFTSSGLTGEAFADRGGKVEAR